MLCSMTGYGEASYQADDLHLSIELRSVNNRYLKVSLRAGRTVQPAGSRVREGHPPRRPPRHHPGPSSLSAAVRGARTFRSTRRPCKVTLRQLRELGRHAGIGRSGPDAAWPRCWHCRASFRSRPPPPCNVDEEWPRIEQGAGTGPGALAGDAARRRPSDGAGDAANARPHRPSAGAHPPAGARAWPSCTATGSTSACATC